MRRSTWLVVTAVASVVALYAALVLLLPGFGPPFIVARRTLVPYAVVAHLVGGATALAVGAWQLNARLRDQRPRVHRWMGRIYVSAVLVGGGAALWLAPGSQAGVPAHLGFGALGLAWLGTTLRGYVAIRAKDEAVHRRWMTRSYALTFAAVTLRIYLPASIALGISFAVAYPVISWLCWVPNLALAEWRLAAHRRLAKAGAA